MDNQLMLTVEYFRVPEHYFWRWAEKGTVIEWKDGQTICYREDLLPILEKLAPDGLPPLGAVLLALAACREDWNTVSAGKRGLLQAMTQWIGYHRKDSSPDMFLQAAVNTSCDLLDMIAALPVSYRTGIRRVGLLYTLFKDEPDKITPSLSRQYIDLFNRGRLDSHIFKPGVHQAEKPFVKEIETLSQAQKRFPHLQQLEMRIRTGLDDLPTPVDLTLPPRNAGDLLQQLAEDSRLTGVVRLTQKLIAALNIPLHTDGSSDRLLGGVSDLANRGSFDRLLISELANDDLSLMARLANNEALFLRREELPSEPDRQRILLIDTTIKMWGTPRIFAVAAALACTCNARPGMKTIAYAMGGDQFLAADLRSREGVIDMLEKLDAALDCRTSLCDFLNGPLQPAHPEIFFITEDAGFHDIRLPAALAGTKASLTACISVDRLGQMKFYEMTNGNRKLAGTARFDLEKLLYAGQEQVRQQTGPPAALQRSLFPLYFPASKMKFKPGFHFEPRKGKMLCITLDQRLLYWTDRAFGARELSPVINSGNYYWRYDKDRVYLLVRSAQKLSLYKMDMQTCSFETVNTSFDKGLVTKVAYSQGHYHVQTVEGIFSIDAESGEIFSGKEQGFVFPSDEHQVDRLNFSDVRKYVNNGYTVWSSIKSIFINKNGELCLDTRYVELAGKEEELRISLAAGHGIESIGSFKKEEELTLIPGAAWVFQRFVSGDGSEVIVDPRGFLHLRSSDKKLPEITLVLVIDKPSAGWASDGKLCGSPYFTGVEGKGDVGSFYYHYIQRFIDIIKKNAPVHKI